MKYNPSVRGIVFDIKHGSINDGPGIRTTVFLKGCSLSCLWCSNPESQSPFPQLMIYEEKCLMEEICGEFCRRQILAKVIEEKRNPLMEELCPAGAARIAGAYMTVEEVLSEVAKDKGFYGDDGGMTLCGGEPLYQPEFSLELLKGSKYLGIGTALYTAGYYPWETVEPILPWTDIILFDVKHIDPEKHREGTGHSNEMILNNLKKLSNLHKRIWIRVPVIPGFNADPDDINQIVTFVNSLKTIERIDFIPYNTVGRSKRIALGMKPASSYYPAVDNDGNT